MLTRLYINYCRAERDHNHECGLFFSQVPIYRPLFVDRQLDDVVRRALSPPLTSSYPAAAALDHPSEVNLHHVQTRKCTFSMITFSYLNRRALPTLLLPTFLTNFRTTFSFSHLFFCLICYRHLDRWLESFSNRSASFCPKSCSGALPTNESWTLFILTSASRMHAFSVYSF